jgi:AraC-like DNA-binding protein
MTTISQMSAFAEEGRRAPTSPVENVTGGGRPGVRAAVHLVGTPAGGRSAVVLVERAQDHLLADLRCPPSAPRLARALGVGEKRLAAAFKAVLGRSMSDLLREVRLETARRAIETRDAPLKQIAWEVGYGDVTNFIHAFRNRFGAPPRRFQKAERPPRRLAA